MPKIKEVLRHVSVEVGKKKRVCFRDRNHDIPAGEPHLAVYEGSPKIRSNYCKECAAPILKAAAARLDKVLKELI